MTSPLFFLIVSVSLVAAFWIYASRRAFSNRGTLIAGAGLIALIALDLVLGASGLLEAFDRFPPPFMPFVAANLALCGAISFSDVGKGLVSRLPFSVLIGFQGFRVPVELLLYTGSKAGLTPPQMTFEGYNFDVVTGLSAIALYFFLRKREARGDWCPGLLMGWNIMGTALVLIVVTIGVFSLPAPFRAFMNEPSNIWVTRAPYILLPGLLVTSAITGHLLVFRKLFSRSNEM